MSQTTDETIIVSHEELSSAKEYKEDDDGDDGGGSDDDESSDVTILLSLGSSPETSTLRGPMEDPLEPVLGRERLVAISVVRNDAADDDASDSTGLLTESSSSKSSSSSGSTSRPSVSSPQRPIAPRTTATPRYIANEPEPSSSTAAVVSSEERGERKPAAADDHQPAELWMRGSILAVGLGVVLFFCGDLIPLPGSRFYQLRCLAWFCLSSGLVQISCYALEHEEENDIDTWMSANPQTRALGGGVLAWESLVRTILAPPYLNAVDGLVATWVIFHGRIGRHLPIAHQQPSPSTLISLWFFTHQMGEAVHFGFVGWISEAPGAQPFSHLPSYDAQVAKIRAVLMPQLVLLSLVTMWARRNRQLRGLRLLYSFDGFLDNELVCNLVVGFYLHHAGDLTGSFWMLCLSACQGIPILVVTIVGRARRGGYKVSTFVSSWWAILRAAQPPGPRARMLLRARAQLLVITLVMGVIEVDNPILLGVFVLSCTLVVACHLYYTQGMLVAAVFWAHVFGILALLRRTVGAIEAMDEYSQKYIAADENHLHGRSGDMLGPLSMKVVDLVCQTDPSIENNLVGILGRALELAELFEVRVM